ncbi:MAG: Holliday junction branch migration protein RuvA [Candidatus Brocadiales bacterium]
MTFGWAWCLSFWRKSTLLHHVIRYLKGMLLKKEDDRIVLLTNGVGYEVRLPVVVRSTYNAKELGEEVELYISYQQAEKQPKPVLVGFNSEPEREFFEKLLTVHRIGTSTAVDALTVPMSRIARAIEDKDVPTLKKLKGIGGRAAEKIVAELNGKVAKYALMSEEAPSAVGEPEDLKKQVVEVLVRQLGYKSSEANRMVETAMERSPQISSPEELFEEVYKGQKT